MWKMKTCINHINHYWKKWWLLKNNGWNSTLKLDKMYPFIPKCTHPFKAWTTHTHKQTHRHTDTHTQHTHTHTHTHTLILWKDWNYFSLDKNIILNARESSYSFWMNRFLIFLFTLSRPLLSFAIYSFYRLW